VDVHTHSQHTHLDSHSAAMLLKQAGRRHSRPVVRRVSRWTKRGRVHSGRSSTYGGRRRTGHTACSRLLSELRGESQGGVQPGVQRAGHGAPWCSGRSIRAAPPVHASRVHASRQGSAQLGVNNQMTREKVTFEGSVPAGLLLASRPLAHIAPSPSKCITNKKWGPAHLAVTAGKCAR
jgi:hypothetical protein